MSQLFQSIEHKALREPFTLAIINPEFSINYQELHHLLQSSVELLNAQSIQAGDRIGLFFDKPINHFVAALACLFKGCTQVPFHKNSTEDFLSKYTQATHCKLLLSDIKIQSSTLNKLEFSISQFGKSPLKKSSPFLLTASTLNQTAILIIGSGTTGNSKIIPVSFSALEIQIQRDIKIHHLQENERFLALSPISYYTSLRRMLACLQVQACAAFIDINKHDLFSFCNRVKVDHLSLILGHAQHLSSSLNTSETKQSRLPYLKTLFIGASPISESIREFLLNKITKNVYIYYGPNEIGPATCVHLNNTGNKVGTIGLPIEGIQLEIIDDNNKPCHVNETGRVRIKAEGLCEAYEEEGSTFSQESFIDGWFYPKDLACIDKDGHIIFKGREDDLIIYYGHNIYPRQIEETLEQHPLVKEAAAFGLLQENGEHAPIAVITLKDNVNNTEDILIKTLKDFCNEKLHTSSPTLIKIEKKLPKNSAGKIIKRELKEKYKL